MSSVIIKLRVKPYYRGNKVLDGNNYQIRVHRNKYNSKWIMSLKGLNNDVEINGFALLGGKNLLGPYGKSELGELWMIDNSGANEDPNYDDIGGRFTLEYIPLEDL